MTVNTKLRKGDEVVVISGSCKGQSGKVEKINKSLNKVHIAGVNIKKRHTKATAAHQESGIVEKVMPLHASNVALVDPKTKKPTRIGYKVEEGKKVRFAKASGTIL